MNIQIALLLSILAGLGTLLGSILIFIPKLNKRDYIPLFLSISATIMLTFSILDLIPESIIYIRSNTRPLKSLFILSFISLAIHNFPEGIATFLSSMVSIRLGLSLSFGIMLHNIPEGICISLPLYQATKNKKKVLLTTFIASIAEPTGAIISYMFLKNYINNLTISIILLFVAGLMITLSINNIYKEVLNNKKYLIKGIIIGLIISLIALSV